MLKEYNIGNYKQTIQTRDKLIIYISCECKHYQIRCLKSQGHNVDKKHYSAPCKHLNIILKYIKTKGYNLKEITKINGTERCTMPLRIILKNRSKGICEMNCQNKATDVHRKIQGSNKGLYSEENCVFICSDCHKVIHS